MKKKLKVCILFLFVFFSISWLFGKQQFTDEERLGRFIFNDRNLSFNGTQSCRTCHRPSVAFADPRNTRKPFRRVVSTGADGVSQGTRNAPTAMYAGFSPILQQDQDGNYLGGMFWDGRATGQILGDPIAEQAQGPFLNPVEMAMADKESVIIAVQAATYADRFLEVYGPDAFDDVDAAYDNLARAIAAYERSGELNPFSSRFDDFWDACLALGIDVSLINESNAGELPQDIFTAQEINGLVLFNGRGNCSNCHLLTAHPDAAYPLFTDFTYDNIGMPANPLLAGNPVDFGLGPVVNDPAHNGKFKVATLRNVGITPPYGHNGFFPTLDEIVHFYNTRDVEAWPLPEVLENVNSDELGDLGLTAEEEADIVAFLLALTDL